MRPSSITGIVRFRTNRLGYENPVARTEIRFDLALVWPPVYRGLQSAPARDLDSCALPAALGASSRAAQHVARTVRAPANNPRRKGRRCSMQAARADNP